MYEILPVPDESLLARDSRKKRFYSNEKFLNLGRKSIRPVEDTARYNGLANDSPSLISPRFCGCSFSLSFGRSAASAEERREIGWCGSATAINANLVISVAPTVSHGRNKYPLATVKTSSIAPSVYDPAHGRHFITVSPARSTAPLFPLRPLRSPDRICIDDGRRDDGPH